MTRYHGGFRRKIPVGELTTDETLDRVWRFIFENPGCVSRNIDREFNISRGGTLKVVRALHQAGRIRKLGDHGQGYRYYAEPWYTQHHI